MNDSMTQRSEEFDAKAWLGDGAHYALIARSGRGWIETSDGARLRFEPSNARGAPRPGYLAALADEGGLVFAEPPRDHSAFDPFIARVSGAALEALAMAKILSMDSAGAYALCKGQADPAASYRAAWSDLSGAERPAARSLAEKLIGRRAAASLFATTKGEP